MKVFLFLVLFFQAYCFANPVSFLPDNFSVEIEQVYKRFGKGKEVRVPFLLEYSFPAKMKYFNQKNKSLFVSNEGKSWYYMPSFIKTRPGTVKVNSGESFRLVGLFDSLRAGLTSNKTYEVKKLSDSKYLLTFSESAQKDFNVKDATLFVSSRALEAMRNSRNQKMPQLSKAKDDFSLEDLDKLTIQYKDKKKLTLEFKNFEKSVSFSSEHFVFSIPENTKVIK